MFSFQSRLIGVVFSVPERAGGFEMLTKVDEFMSFHIARLKYRIMNCDILEAETLLVKQIHISRQTKKQKNLMGY